MRMVEGSNGELKLIAQLQPVVNISHQVLFVACHAPEPHRPSPRSRNSEFAPIRQLEQPPQIS